jgi:signal transduction histidine kinase
MPRDIQEALFETAMKVQDAERQKLARLLHDRHPRTLHPAKPN